MSTYSKMHRILDIFYMEFTDGNTTEKKNNIVRKHNYCIQSRKFSLNMYVSLTILFFLYM